MYRSSSKIFQSKQDLKNYIEDYDVYNARILDLLKEREDDKVEYVIKTFEYQPDLIAMDIYGSTSYTSFLMIIAGIGLESYTKGTILRILPKTVIDSVIAQL